MSENPIDQKALLRLQMLAAIGEIGAGVSHETRNLMTGIIGFAQVARQRAAEPDAAMRYVAMIEREALRCVELLEHHLELARVVPSEVELVDVAQVVEHVVAAARHQVELQRIELHVDVPAVPSVRGQRGELAQVVLNLLINAMHATPPGGEVAITAASRAGWVELAVSDTGEGVPAELRDKIFEAFFTTKQGNGTGLGLALCRRIVIAHGGTLELDTTRSRGAQFVVRLPVPG